MINRIIIRIKVLQAVYAFYQKDTKDIKSAENELMRSLHHSYDLYHHLLLLIVLLTDVEQKRLDLQKHKYIRSEKEMNPNTRFIDNRFAEQLRTNKQLEKFVNAHGMLWNQDDSNFVKKMLNTITDSEIYKEYLLSSDTHESDREFWRKVFKDIILKDDDVKEIACDNSIYIDDDFELIGSFALKTIRRFDTDTAPEQDLLPMFKDMEDYEYAIHLLHRTILEKEENSERINRQIKNWDLERIALVDLLIMQIALAELKNFPSIPVNVTLNEYIDLARYYSTPKSAHFINGILDAIVNELKTENLLFKN